MPEIANPRELFLHELGDILYVERALAQEALPKLIGEVGDGEFKRGLEKHLDQTRRHVTNVEKVFKTLGETPQAEECIGFEGLKSEHDTLSEEASPALIDLVDLGGPPHRALRDRSLRGPDQDGTSPWRGRGAGPARAATSNRRRRPCVRSRS